MKKKLLTSIFLFLMQSYGVFLLIPRNLANSSSTYMDKRTIFGQIGETSPKLVQSVKYIVFFEPSSIPWQLRILPIFLFSSKLFVDYFIFFFKRLLLSKIFCTFANATIPFAHDWGLGIRLRTVVLERTDRDEVVHILLIVRYISYD